MAGIATPFQIRPKGIILFLEEVGERAYRLDRYWEQLEQMGFLKTVSAIILGDFTEGNEPNGQNLIWDILKNRAEQMKIPVFHGLPVGHGEIQRVLPLGMPMTITRTKKSLLFGSINTGVKSMTIGISANSSKTKSKQ
jgi:muramoyltetrapeptide carboxypeptidase